MKKEQSTAIRRTRSDVIFDTVNTIILVLLMLLVIYPLIYVVSCSFSTPLLVVQSKVVLFPKGFTTIAYEHVFHNELIISGYLNTIFYTLLGTTINVLMTIMAAFPLAQRSFKIRGPVTILFTFTMLFTGGLVPTFLTVQRLGMVDTVWALILPGTINAWNMFIMKNYFQTSIPGELYEAARIDGANWMVILTRLVLPLSAPILAVMVLYYGVSHWNSYFSALIYLRDRMRYPLQLVMRSYFSGNDYAEQGGGGEDSTTALLLTETVKYALIVVASFPMLCAYPFMQRFFVKGVMLGAVKG
ncbi:MAG: carbohydrate ABC transporter permease [Eubacteriales bacterium]|nr:carbohydrate ABC transporter permease [Eubacteriales bacterium]